MDHTTVTNGVNRGRNSVPPAVVLPNGNNPRLRHFNSSPSPPSLPDLDDLKHPSSASYTSLKDIIINHSTPSTILSPTPPSTTTTTTSTTAYATVSSPSFGSGYEISIRNRLVKQAAWAYLQPTVPSSPSSSSRCVCFSGECFGPIIDVFRRLSCEAVTRVYDWLADVLWLILCR